ncbi:MAG: hypothetical protein V1915_04605 [Candidatus Bathyarchaeota archaeon]
MTLVRVPTCLESLRDRLEEKKITNLESRIPDGKVKCCPNISNIDQLEDE